MQVNKVSWNQNTNTWLLAILGLACAIVAVWGASNEWEPQTCGTCGAILYEDGFCPSCRK